VETFVDIHGRPAGGVGSGQRQGGRQPVVVGGEPVWLRGEASGGFAGDRMGATSALCAIAAAQSPRRIRACWTPVR
jgi:hypothetical protein